jgi:Organic Anion Transporter Polypeptide (OATP) family
MLIFAVGCLLYGSVFLIYGPSEEALVLTKEYGATSDSKTSANVGRENLCDKTSKVALDFQNPLNSSTLFLQEPVETCNSESTSDGADLIPQVMFFAGLGLAAIGDILLGTIGITYLDDNVHKDKSPFLVSVTNFIRKLGPPFGFLLASFCLKIYVAPDLHPTITDSDPRWIGAWWLGWFIIGFASLLGALLLGNS